MVRIVIGKLTVRVTKNQDQLNKDLKQLYTDLEQTRDLIGIDIAAPLKLNKNGNTHFNLALENISKYCITVSTPRTTSEETIRIGRDRINNVFGKPYAILSDQGRNFELRAFDEFCKSQGIKNQENVLPSAIHDDWDEALIPDTFAYSNAVHDSTIEEQVRDKIGIAQMKQKKQYDKNVRDKNSFKPGDLVC
ncbi:unnamed protein product [Brachionus calyciflorus]|uniref:Integrase catalytic domain-containing protein n=1 Tax=Brachionus calyciflorus TaxID=104777 RepID=A0A814KPK0_9BILA|nr:unnamed protein product [Brachionus calyciflorus]